MYTEYGKDIVAKRGDYEFTSGELSVAFDKVKNKNHWKNPIKRTVKFASHREELATIEAIIFYTGSVPTITQTAGRDKVLVQAAGYYAAVGA